METETNQKMNDHDLIVSMHTTLKRAVDDLRALGDKVTDFNNNYAKKDEVDKQLIEIKTDLKMLQRIAYGGLGILGAIEFYFNYLRK